MAMCNSKLGLVCCLRIAGNLKLVCHGLSLPFDLLFTYLSHPVRSMPRCIAMDTLDSCQGAKGLSQCLTISTC